MRSGRSARERQRYLRRELLFLGWLWHSGCAANDAGLEPSLAAPDAESGSLGASPPGCSPPEGLAPPHDIEALRQWINALPKPTTLDCFIHSLHRPLRLQASLSKLSAQQTTDRTNPRIFVFLEPLVLTLLARGEGSHLLEMGQLEPGDRSLKAEIEFPVLEAVSPSAPYDTARFDDSLTECAFCHGEERRAAEITVAAAFSSQALRPPPENRVSLQALETVAKQCSDEGSRARDDAEVHGCALLEALFTGPVPPLDAEFPTTLPICFPDQ